MEREGRVNKEKGKCERVLGMAENRMGWTHRGRVGISLIRVFGANCIGLTSPKLKAELFFFFFFVG